MMNLNGKSEWTWHNMITNNVQVLLKGHHLHSIFNMHIDSFISTLNSLHKSEIDIITVFNFFIKKHKMALKWLKWTKITMPLLCRIMRTWNYFGMLNVNTNYCNRKSLVIFLYISNLCSIINKVEIHFLIKHLP